MSAKLFRIDVYFPGDLSAGMRAYSEAITIAVDSGDPRGDAGEFERHMMHALADWYDGAQVTLRDVEQGELPRTDTLAPTAIDSLQSSAAREEELRNALNNKTLELDRAVMREKDRDQLRGVKGEAVAWRYKWDAPGNKGGWQHTGNAAYVMEPHGEWFVYEPLYTSPPLAVPQELQEWSDEELGSYAMELAESADSFEQAGRMLRKFIASKRLVDAAPMPRLTDEELWEFCKGWENEALIDFARAIESRLRPTGE